MKFCASPHPGAPPGRSTAYNEQLNCATLSTTSTAPKTCRSSKAERCAASSTIFNSSKPPEQLDQLTAHQLEEQDSEHPAESVHRPGFLPPLN